MRMWPFEEDVTYYGDDLFQKGLEGLLMFLF